MIQLLSVRKRSPLAHRTSSIGANETGEVLLKEMAMVPCGYEEDG
jgi:hypothetical protein